MGRVDREDALLFLLVLGAVAGLDDRPAGGLAVPFDQQAVAGQLDAVLVVDGGAALP